MINNFYTSKGYESRNPSALSPAMEDYLEMIYRLTEKESYIRISELAESLHVKPSSTSKMAGRLKELEYIEFKPYGMIRLTAKGQNTGYYLMNRHKTLHKLFCIINHSDNQLEITERVEHFIDLETVQNIEKFIQQFDSSNSSFPSQ